MSHGQDNRLQVGVQSASLVQPSLTADVAVPVSDVTILVAGGILSLDGHDVVLDLAGLAAQVAIHVASAVILVVASGRSDGTGAVDNDGGVDGSEIKENIADEQTIILDDSQIIGAGSGIVLHLEGDGEEVLLTTHLVGGSSSSHVLHEAVLHDTGILVNLTKHDVLIAGGVVFVAYLDGGDPHLFVLIEISDNLKDVGVKTDLDQSTDQTGGVFQVQQVDFNLELFTGVDLFSASDKLDSGLVSSSYGSERNHRTQHQCRQENSQKLFHYAFTFLKIFWIKSSGMLRS